MTGAEADGRSEGAIRWAVGIPGQGRGATPRASTVPPHNQKCNILIKYI
jgi:hypothetical protein